MWLFYEIVLNNRTHSYRHSHLLNFKQGFEKNSFKVVVWFLNDTDLLIVEPLLRTALSAFLALSVDFFPLFETKKWILEKG